MTKNAYLSLKPFKGGEFDMKGPNSKVSFNPGFFVGKKILTLVLLFCFLLFFSLVYAGGPGDPDNPADNTPTPVEHPWDEVNSQNKDKAPKHPAINEVLIFPRGSLDSWIIIHSAQVKNGDNEKVQSQIHSSDKNRGKFFIFF